MFMVIATSFLRYVLYVHMYTIADEGRKRNQIDDQFEQ